MGITVRLQENQDVRVTEEIVETDPPDRVTFAVEGTITMTGELLGEFEGSALQPVEIGISVDDSRTVAIDLAEDATLRLDTVDVGVETPDAGDLSPGMDAMSDGESESSDDAPGAIAFTVEGVVRDVRGDAVRTIADGSPSLETTTFDVRETVRSDGGSGDDVLYEVSLLGYAVTIYRDGRIVVDTRGSATDVELP